MGNTKKEKKPSTYIFFFETPVKFNRISMGKEVNLEVNSIYVRYSKNTGAT